MRLGVVVLVGLWLAACSGGSSGGHTTPTGSPVLAQCAQGSDCQSGICLKDEEGQMACSQSCQTDADCVDPTGYAGVCRTFGNNGKLCALPCATPQGWTCIDNKPVKCSVAGEKGCLDCGCPDPGTWCAGDHCAAKKQLFKPCGADEECISGDCAAYGTNTSNVCLGALGASCTDQNCQICQNGTYCSRHCDGDYDCPDNGMCLFWSGQATGICYLACPSADQSICDPYNMNCTISANNSWYCSPI